MLIWDQTFQYEANIVRRCKPFRVRRPSSNKFSGTILFEIE